MNYCKIAEGLDVFPLQRALIQRADLFGRRDARKNTYMHADMSDIWVRHDDYEKTKDPEAWNREHISRWYPESLEIPEARRLCLQLMTLVEGEQLGGVLITKLPPDGEIKPHVDHGWHAGYYDKFFVPILNDDGAVFGFPEGAFQARPGEVWWFRNDVSHWVKNASTRDRIGMIVCIRTFKGV